MCDTRSHLSWGSGAGGRQLPSTGPTGHGHPTVPLTAQQTGPCGDRLETENQCAEEKCPSHTAQPVLLPPPAMLLASCSRAKPGHWGPGKTLVPVGRRELRARAGSADGAGSLEEAASVMQQAPPRRNTWGSAGLPLPPGSANCLSVEVALDGTLKVAVWLRGRPPFPALLLPTHLLPPPLLAPLLVGQLGPLSFPPHLFSGCLFLSFQWLYILRSSAECSPPPPCCVVP